MVLRDQGSADSHRYGIKRPADPVALELGEAVQAFRRRSLRPGALHGRFRYNRLTAGSGLQ
jgi:hypothetical protein